jgi:hypothetical protein
MLFSTIHTWLLSCIADETDDEDVPIKHFIKAKKSKKEKNDTTEKEVQINKKTEKAQQAPLKEERRGTKRKITKDVEELVKDIKRKKTESESQQEYFPFTGKKLQLRCSPSNLINFMEKLTEDQKNAVKQMGFGKTLGLMLHSIPTSFGYWVLQNYNPETDIVNDGEQQFKITASLINEVFGIPKGGVTVKASIRPNANDPVVEEWRSQFGEKVPKKIFIKDFTLHLTKRKDSGRMFKLNFLVIFFTVLAEIMKSNTVNQRFLTSLTTKTDVKKLNWCEYILTCLRKTRQGWFGTEEELFNGPLLLLTVNFIKLFNYLFKVVSFLFTNIEII